MHRLNNAVVNASVRERNLEALAAAGVELPTFAQLADPKTIPAGTQRALRDVGRDDADPRNLFRVHWYNSREDAGFTDVPEHVVLPTSLTGVEAKIVVLFGNRFPLIGAHKVLPAYACLVPRLVSGEFDLHAQRAVWPSTGNYCRGGVAISRILGCRGVAVLPAGMSRERFEWLERWVTDPADVIRTPGTESNVKEIYDACKVLDRDPKNMIFNQFSEYANYLVHYTCTGAAAARVFDALGARHRLRAFVSASGSAGTLAAGDYLKEKYGSLTVAVEALECPTLLANGFGEHNIQGIGDKHVPLIHNVMASDVVTAISDRATDEVNVLFNSPAGRAFLAGRRNVPAPVLEALASFGVSSICNVTAAIKTAKYYRMTADDVVVTVATDGASMYASEMQKTVESRFGGSFDEVDAALVCGRHLLGAATDNFAELSTRDRERVFNLGYFTWVEQQGCSIDEFTARRRPSFWKSLHEFVPAWDAMIEEANRAVAR